MKRIAIVLGTRPEAIKLAPIIQELRRSPSLKPFVVVTGQHREMVRIVLDIFEIRPHRDLDIFQIDQTLTDVTVRALKGLERLFEEDRPDMVLVQGDTTTTLAGAMAAFYQRLPVAHVEAGMRTRDPYAPYPEEINRRLTAQLASLHFAPTANARDNLLAEGIDPAAIVLSGDTVIDAMRWVRNHNSRRISPHFDRLNADPRRLLLVTAHRRESWGVPLERVATAVADLASADPNLLVVFPVHPNPIVRNSVVPAVEGLENVNIIEPLGYEEFVRLMERADLILTDSGGIQKEGPALGTPVLVMREKTEWLEPLDEGSVRLVGTRPSDIVREVYRLLNDKDAYAEMVTHSMWAEAGAARRIIHAIERFFEKP